MGLDDEYEMIGACGDEKAHRVQWLDMVGLKPRNPGNSEGALHVARLPQV